MCSTSPCWTVITVPLAVTFVDTVPRYKEPTTNYTIFELDRRVYDLISEPVEGRGEELYQLLYTLHLRMLHIHEVFHFDVDDDAAKKEAKDIVLNNGLQIFNLSANEGALKEKYKYINNQVYETVDLVNNCLRLYNSTQPLIMKKITF